MNASKDLIEHKDTDGRCLRKELRMCQGLPVQARVQLGRESHGSFQRGKFSIQAKGYAYEFPSDIVY